MYMYDVKYIILYAKKIDKTFHQKWSKQRSWRICWWKWCTRSNEATWRLSGPQRCVLSRTGYWDRKDLLRSSLISRVGGGPVYTKRSSRTWTRLTCKLNDEYELITYSSLPVSSPRPFCYFCKRGLRWRCTIRRCWSFASKLEFAHLQP